MHHGPGVQGWSGVLLTCSLLLNVVVLVPVARGMLRGDAWAVEAYGAPSPARQILLAVYLAILGLSLILLVRAEPRWAVGLLTVQIAYKLLTPVTVGTLAHPVVLSNLAIAAFHSATLAALWVDGRR